MTSPLGDGRDRVCFLELQVIATGMPFPEFGLTYRDIEADGFRIDRKVEMLLAQIPPLQSASRGPGDDWLCRCL